MFRQQIDDSTTPSALGAGAPGLRAVALTFLLPLACVTPGGEEGATTGEPDDWAELVDPVPGTRLRPIFREAEDGTKVHVGWQDTLLDTPCDFMPTPSAGMRCVSTAGGNGVWLYADAACTEPVLQDSSIPEGATVVYERGDSCFDHTYWEVGEPVSDIYYNANGPCEWFSNDPSHRVTVIPHEDFVGATLTPQDGNSRIVPLLLEADDGSRQIFGAWDRIHDEQVTAAPDDGDLLRWFGHFQPRVSTTYYADPDCTERVAIDQCVPDWAQPTTAKETESGCGEILGRTQLREEVGELFSKDDSDNCVASGSLGGSYRMWRVGDPLEDGDFAEASAVDVGGERMRHDLYASPEGEPFLASGRVYDRELDEVECRWRDPVTYASEPMSSASFDCMPVDSADFTGRFADAECSQPTAARFVFEDDCLGPALYAYGDSMAAAITGPASGEGSYGIVEGEMCVQLPPSEPPDGGSGEDEYYLVESTLTEVAHAVDVIE